MKRESVPHHYRSVPQNTVTEIFRNLKRLPEDMRLMYLHLWCLGSQINEVCSTHYMNMALPYRQSGNSPDISMKI